MDSGAGAGAASRISGFNSSSTPQAQSALGVGSGAEIIFGEHSDTRMKLLPLTNSHGRHTTAAPERALVSVGEWPSHTQPS
jgi:hypothetical protein